MTILVILAIIFTPLVVVAGQIVGFAVAFPLVLAFHGLRGVVRYLANRARSMAVKFA